MTIPDNARDHAGFYTPVRMRWLLANDRRTQAIVFVSWITTILLCIGLGLASIVYQWSGLPITFGGLELNVTVYPPLVLCVFWVLWFGFWWGFIPAYLATLVLAIYSGMPVGWSLIFAFADPLGLALLAVAYLAIPVEFDLRSINSVLVFVALSFISGVVGSTGSFIWTHTNNIAVYDVLPIWQGWWLGAFLQNLIFVAPLLYLFSPSVCRWRAKLIPSDVKHHPSKMVTILISIFIVSGVLIYLYMSVKLGSAQIRQALVLAEYDRLRTASLTFIALTDAMFWVNGVVILFFAFFGFQLFNYWTMSLRHSEADLRSAYKRLDKRSRTDHLTGLYNRSTWEPLIASEYERAAVDQGTSSLLLLDIDYFKKINDNHGHLSGDKVLRAVADVLKREKREGDIAGRYGGEEFIIALPNTSEEGAYKLAERIRSHLALEIRLEDGTTMRVTASIGLAVHHGTGNTDYYSWIARADRALYQAKLEGRNRTVVFDG